MPGIERVVLTESQITVPKVAKWEIPLINLTIILLKLTARCIFPITGNKDLIQPALEVMDGTRTRLQVSRDFNNGRISGRFLRPTEIAPKPVHDMSMLVKARQKARILRGNN